MSTKNPNVQVTGRRTPLSLNAATKQNNKPTNDKINVGSKETKETTANNQKTESMKKDSQQDRKPSTDKRQPTADTKKSSSSDNKRTDEPKNVAKPEDNKKNQNGVSTNGVKSKDKHENEDATKSKPETSSTNGTPRMESQKPIEKKREKDEAAVVTSKPLDSKTKTEGQTNEKEKINSESNRKTVDEKKKDKEKKDEEKLSEEKPVKSAVAAKIEEKKNDTEEASLGVLLDNNKPEIVSLSQKEKNINEANKVTASPVDKQLPSTVEQPSVENKRDTAPSTQQGEQLDDVEMMEPLVLEDEIRPQISASSTPAKHLTSSGSSKFSGGSANKMSPRSEKHHQKDTSSHTPDRSSCPRTFSAISGRRSIRPMGDYTFNGKIRESYRKINTELDFTTSSLNVTVGSEVPNNDSFSFLSASRKRDRASQSQHSVMDISPPKRPRIDMSDFFSVVASPITKLRARLSRATVQSTPKKQVEEMPVIQNAVESVSAVNDDETMPIEDLTVNSDVTVGNIAIEEDENDLKPGTEDLDYPAEKFEIPAIDGVERDDDIQIKEIKTTDTQAKKKCSIM